ncbi:DUF1707 SHOCT-like domain-containing protein [Haloactinomyces albus]|uniref:DUF1707 domain-containing protein n=1 Tax=Haloactinomyces albus TaxID=1352928 RepID=A0AAE3ZCT3_9ACTN|nr:DUF1707 domain-containing protein [Haloactinomyces albus]MDR7301336.1 hypothetical protein [Haloactinomyces albus]
MSENQRDQHLRIGDPERNQAINLLGEHLSAGRLDVQEFDERCARVASARFRSDLSALFDDLPAPRPAAPAQQEKSARGVGGAVLGLSVLLALVALALLTRQLLLLVLVLGGVAFWLLRRRG